MQISKLLQVESATLLLVVASASCLLADETQNQFAAQAESAVVKYNGMTYEEALAGYQSDLNPAIQANALEALIQFAIRDHHANDVARLLVKESRAIPLEFLCSINPKSDEPLAQLVERFNKTPQTEDDLWVSIDEFRHWRRVLMGIHRLALPQRAVFEQAALDPKAPARARLLARFAVQDADVQAAAVQEYFKALSPEPKSTVEVSIDEIKPASVQASSPFQP